MKNISLRLRDLFLGLWGKASQHKIISIILVAAILGGGYYAYNNLTAVSAQTRYVLTTVAKGTITSTVSGSGQVSASTQVDISPQVSANVVSVYVKQGDNVKAGQLLVKLDSTNAEKAVESAQADLQNAQLALQKLNEPPTQLSLTQADNAVTRAKGARDKAVSTLNKDYLSAYNTISGVISDLSGMVSSLYIITPNAWQDSGYSYSDIQSSYIQSVTDYKILDQYSDQTKLDAMINEVYKTTQMVDAVIRSAGISTYSVKTGTDLANISTAQQSIQTDKSAVTDALGTILEQEQALTKLKAGPDPLDVQSQELAVKQKGNAMANAEDTLANYSIRAPFDGILAKLNVNVGNAAASASVASPSTIGTIITKEGIANISLNEVDVAKIKIGDKATLTFDAFPNLTISGTVTQIDTLGTVTQGVVNYNVKISFDTQNNQIKPGMSVSAAIITNIHQDVLIVPASAVKSQSGTNYVQILKGVPNTLANLASAGITSQTSPVNQIVQTGLTNTTMVEIMDGLNEGDLIISRTVNSSAASATSSTSTARTQGLGGLTGGGGLGAVLRTTGSGAAAGR